MFYGCHATTKGGFPDRSQTCLGPRDGPARVTMNKRLERASGRVAWMQSKPWACKGSVLLHRAVMT